MKSKPDNQTITRAIHIKEDDTVFDIIDRKIDWLCPSCGSPNLDQLGSIIEHQIECENCHKMFSFDTNLTIISTISEVKN